MKKKVFGVLLIATSMIVAISCKKENLNNNSVQQTSNEEQTKEFIAQLKANVNNVKNDFTPTKTLTDPSFSTNPYDSFGVNHNIQIAEIHNHRSFSTKITTAIKVFDTIRMQSYGDTIVTDVDSAATFMKTFAEDVIDNNEVDSVWIYTLNIPSAEKSTLHTYYTEVYSTTDQELRNSISKSIEEDVISSSVLSDESKARLLKSFSIFRHSTFYWDSFNGYRGISPFAEAVDGLVAMMCMDGSITHPDGLDISCPGVANQIGAIVSAVADIYF